MPTVVVVTTKPSIDQAEYGIQNEDGSFAVHGVLIPVDAEKLSDEEKSAISDARAVLLRLATEDAKAKNLI